MMTDVEKRQVGLCVECAHVRRVPSSRGSIFYRCARAEVDARFPKYPRLPVIQCAGYEAVPTCSRKPP